MLVRRHLRRWYAWAVFALLGLPEFYNSIGRRFLPDTVPELDVPATPYVGWLLGAGVGVAAFMTYHELRVRLEPRQVRQQGVDALIALRAEAVQIWALPVNSQQRYFEVWEPKYAEWEKRTEAYLLTQFGSGPASEFSNLGELPGKMYNPGVGEHNQAKNQLSKQMTVLDKLIDRYAGALV